MGVTVSGNCQNNIESATLVTSCWSVVTAVRVLSSAKLTQLELKFDTVSVCSKVASKGWCLAGTVGSGHQGSILGSAVSGDSWLAGPESGAGVQVTEAYGTGARAWLVLPGHWRMSPMVMIRSQGPHTRLRRAVTRLEWRESILHSYNLQCHTQHSLQHTLTLHSD